VPNREDRGIEVEALFDQDRQRPQRGVRDRIARGALSAHRAARGVLDRGPGAAQVAAKPVGANFVDEFVRVPVAGDLVSAIRDRSAKKVARLAV